MRFASTGRACRTARSNRRTAGIRPKISARGEPNADFVIEGRETHGVPSVINLFGIESPGLTASLAIADQVVVMANS